MTRMVRWIGALAVLAGVTAAQADTKVVFGYVPADGNLAEFVAQDLGLYARHGLAVTLQPIPNGGTIPAAALSGSIQLGQYTSSGLLQAAEGGLDLVGVMAETRSTREAPGAYLMRRKDLVVNGAADLKGRTVGVSAYNNVLDLLLRKWLTLHGVSPNDVHILETPFVSMHDLMRTGRLDAATVVDPFAARMVADGTGVELPDFLDEIHPNMVLPVVFTTRTWFEANKPTMAAFRDATREAIAAIKADPARAREIESHYLKFETPVLPAFDVTLTPEDLRIFQQIGVELGILTGKEDLTRIVPSY